MFIPKPEPGEYAPYTIEYIDLLPDDGQVLRHLATNNQRMRDLVLALAAEKLVTPHAADEWTVQDILMHVIDTERVFAYRALRMARNDTTDLPGFPHETYVPAAQANQRQLRDILAEYSTVRHATISLFQSFDAGGYAKAAKCNQRLTSVRALAYSIAGHELHHLYSIQQNYA